VGSEDDTPSDRPRTKRLQTATERDMESLREKRVRDRRGQTPVGGVRVSHPSDQVEALARAVEEGQTRRLTPPRVEAAGEIAHRRGGTTFEASMFVEEDDGIPEAIDFESVSGVTETMLSDPDKLELVAKIEREKRVRANAIMKAMGDKPPGPRMSSLERTVRRLKGVIVAIAIPFASSAVLVGKWLMSKAAEEERARIEREQILERDRDFEQRIRLLETITPRYSFPSGPSRPEPNPRKEP
jgi:hypothetical protein